MTEIKFRGKTVGTEEWIYGSLLIKCGSYYINEGKPSSDFLKVIPETVGQYLSLIHILCEKFREKFDAKRKAEKSIDKYDGSAICQALITEARVRKIREKGRNGELSVEFCGDMRDMRWIPHYLYEDILEEDLYYIATHFEKVDFKRLKSRVVGFTAPFLKDIIAR